MIKLVFEYSKYIFSEKITFLKKMFLIISFLKMNIRYIIIRKKKELKKTKKYNLVKFIHEFSFKANKIYSITNRSNFIGKPVFFDKNNNLFSSIEGLSPDIDIYIINDCVVFAKTSSIACDVNVYNNNLFHILPIYDFKNLIVQNIDSYKSKNVIFNLNNNLYDDNNLMHIHLINEHSSNYYHWLFEIMPKFIKICEVINASNQFRNEKYILLIDQNLPSQFYDILDVYSTINYEIKIVNNYNSIHINKMMYCSDFWLSIDNTKFKPNIKKEFFVDREAVLLIKYNIKKRLSNKLAYKKIYIERSEKQARYLENNIEVKDYLLKNNFEIIAPENLTFYEQAEIFNEAKIVVGSSGAVFSNVVFMQENTHAIVFSPNTIASNYYIFQQMADVSNVNLIHLLTDNKSYLDNVHSSSLLNITKLQLLLEQIVKKEFK